MIWVRFILDGEPAIVKLAEGREMEVLERAEQRICGERNELGLARDRRYIDDRVRYLQAYDAAQKP